MSITITSSSTTTREIGTLVVVVRKAYNLPDMRRVGKQHPYCVCIVNGKTQRTSTTKGGGQHPKWDEEFRFHIHEPVEGASVQLPLRKTNGTTAGGILMKLACYADASTLIGETDIDLKAVLETGESDEWYRLTKKDRFAGEVNVELTFLSNRDKMTDYSSSEESPTSMTGDFPSAKTPRKLRLRMESLQLGNFDWFGDSSGSTGNTSTLHALASPQDAFRSTDVFDPYLWETRRPSAVPPASPDIAKFSGNSKLFPFPGIQELAQQRHRARMRIPVPLADARDPSRIKGGAEAVFTMDSDEDEVGPSGFKDSRIVSGTPTSQRLGSPFLSEPQAPKTPMEPSALQGIRPPLLLSSTADYLDMLPPTFGHFPRAPPVPPKDTQGQWRASEAPTLWDGMGATMAKGSRRSMQTRSSLMIPSVGLTAETVLTQLIEVLHRDKRARKSLLQGSRANSQRVVNAFRSVLLLGLLEPGVSAAATAILLRLCKKLELYPECPVLRGLELSSKDPIAEGGFGAIWRGTLHNRSVSVKVAKVYQTSDFDLIARAYSREAVLWSTFSHPNVLPFYGMFFMDDDKRRMCLISPWIERGNIYQYLKSYPESDRSVLSLDTAKGLRYLHTKNVIHGDMKGANILVTSTGRACLADFGLSNIILNSQALHWTHTATSQESQAGSVRWQAPEIFSNAKPSKSTDIYALGCVLYEIYTGIIPFAEIRYDTAVMFAVLRGQRPDIPPYISPGVSRIVQDCWEEQADRRPPIDLVCDMLLVLLDGGGEDAESDWDAMSHSAFRAFLHGQVEDGTLNESLALVSDFLSERHDRTGTHEHHKAEPLL